jgi:hypothetical protein
MDAQTENTALLGFFKALGDSERLKVAGFLANETLTLAELAKRLKLRPAEVAKHLDELTSQGLIEHQERGYRLVTAALEKKARAILAQSRPPADPDRFEGEAYDRKVLASYIAADGSLKNLPAQEKKLLVILRHVVKQFQTGERYPEKQVNTILWKFHEDTASLRRYLVDFKFMARENGIYWVLEKPLGQ